MVHSFRSSLSSYRYSLLARVRVLAIHNTDRSPFLCVPDGTIAMTNNRCRLCKLIASLPSTATREDVASILEPTINCSKSSTTGSTGEYDIRSDDENVDGVTPLMIACDKAQLGVLQYIGEAIRSEASIIELVGHPLDTSCEKCGGNTAMHHAASVGFIEGIDWLVTILTEAETNIDPEQRRISEQYSYARYLLHLLSRRNANGDTPCMMAAISGQESLIRNWICTFQKSYVNDEGVPFSEVRRVFEMSNEGGDTACSLAGGHGLYAIVSLLIEPISTCNEENVIIEASHSDLEKCRAALDRMDSLMPMVKKKGNQKEQEDFITRRQDTQRCIDILELACDRLAQKNMSELLLGATDATTTEPAKKNKKKQRRKRDKRKFQKKKYTPAIAAPVDNENQAGQIPANDTSQTGNAWRISGREREFQKHSSEPETLTSPRVVTLQDGTVISTSERTSYVAEQEDSLPLSSEKSDTTGKSIDDMLRDRCREPRVHSGVEAVMDSLCLETSMLLLPSHSMALCLSPCQLDAVESILNTQLRATKEAKEIQARIRNQ